MSKTMRDKLAEGEKVPVTNEELEELEQIMPHITLHYKLTQMEKSGEVSTIKGSFIDSRRWVYQGRSINMIYGYSGLPKWDNSPQSGFNYPHDLAVDEETNTLVAFARS